MEDIQKEKEEIRIDEKSYQLNEWKLTRKQVQLVHAFGLGPLAIIRPGRIDYHLVAANIERWFYEINTFHFNIHTGEMTPTLFDVYEILGLVGDGNPDTCRPIKGLRKFIEDNLGIVPDGNLASLRHTWLKANFRELAPDVTPVQVYRYTRAYLLFLISVTIFADASVSTVPTSPFIPLSSLGKACTFKRRHFSGSATLMRCWSYEHIMHMRPIPHNIPPNIPRAKRWELPKKYDDNPHNLMPPIRQEIDNLQPNEVIWNPYLNPDEVISDDWQQAFQTAMCPTTLIFDDIA
ncbi:hypothetical protein AMTR_s00023p00229700 [Amborella trichopoda]|uniref:Aminotransferase-like plant mobile domain-containing protein n=1 Tax=Amborella trichopoda TaxID=13333 RepID=W1NKH0_AMBTC|nr:hypothetical protein AMTR_s00023p00229700 [Amborella trichopoda]